MNYLIETLENMTWPEIVIWLSAYLFVLIEAPKYTIKLVTRIKQKFNQ